MDCLSIKDQLTCSIKDNDFELSVLPMISNHSLLSCLSFTFILFEQITNNNCWILFFMDSYLTYLLLMMGLFGHISTITSHMIKRMKVNGKYGSHEWFEIIAFDQMINIVQWFFPFCWIANRLNHFLYDGTNVLHLRATCIALSYWYGNNITSKILS